MAEQQILSLVEMLAQEYERAMHLKNKECKDDDAQIDTMAAIQAISTFRGFCRDYLSQHRPTSLQAVDGNYLVTFTNMKQSLISPAVTTRPGEMQASNSVPITGPLAASIIDFGASMQPGPVGMPVTPDDPHQGLTGMTLPQPGPG